MWSGLKAITIYIYIYKCLMGRVVLLETRNDFSLSALFVPNNWILLYQIFYELFWVEIVDIIEDYAMRCQVVNIEWHFPSFLATSACSLGYASMPCCS